MTVYGNDKDTDTVLIRLKKLLKGTIETLDIINNTYEYEILYDYVNRVMLDRIQEIINMEEDNIEKNKRKKINK